MDDTRIDRAQSLRLAETRRCTAPAADGATVEVRILDDWELAFASGGEATAEWP